MWLLSYSELSCSGLTSQTSNKKKKKKQNKTKKQPNNQTKKQPNKKKKNNKKTKNNPPKKTHFSLSSGGCHSKLIKPEERQS
jgi:hypothetical protein